jgi:hypothetical protein
MAIYGVYTGVDMKTYVCDLKLTDDRSATLPVYRLSIAQPRKQTGAWQDLHVSTFWGSMTIILLGQITFGVTGGERRGVTGKAGDIFVFIDTEGDGHSTANPAGGELFYAVNTRFADSIEGLWEDIKKGFTGWPDNVLPPRTYAAGGPPEGRHAGPR